MKTDASILIVGAGISGFTSAVKLIEKGFSNIVILEAENRIGGRIFTTEFAKGLVDLGAQWCHGIKGNLVYEIASSEALDETKMDFTKMTFTRSDGSQANGETTESLMKLCEKILYDLTDKDVCTLEEVLTKKYFESLEVNNVDKKLAVEILNNFKKRECSYCGCESLSKIKVDGNKKFRDCEGPTWLNWKDKGYKTIFDCIAMKANLSREEVEKKIIFNMKVENINWSDKKVAIKCSSGETFHADHIIVTVSLGVLKYFHSTMFTPELPIEKKLAIETIHFGAVGKIFIELDRKFWSDDFVGFSLLWTEKDLEEIKGTDDSWLENIYCFYTVNLLPNVLLGRLAGNAIAQMEMLSDEKIIQSCKRVFKKFLPNENFNIVKTKTSKWKTNENFNGTYSYHEKDCPTVVRHMSEPLYNENGVLSVQFAGEATHEYFFSTVHGAMESGIREANRLTEIYETH